ncbi:DUF262 domain-containing protein [Vibrio splendidus]|uniref:DUF262 domain-containing protein n=1 Tax=Vibrio splendidus TaxID=29497 RepID=UPI0021B202B2|nr:DUF262 domain-containing protein [Vibrio splendidus]UXA00504.1 DUF262 domain-containing protein [Vibrio splendidus]
MQFKDVLFDLEKLIGKQLQSVNPKTAPIFLTRFDIESKKYFISSNPNEEGNARYFSELESIWSELTHKGFCSVDQALFGSGTSRNQPETLFANLPYIQYFRFKGKKHIFLRGTHVHELGTLSEVIGDELSLVLSKIDNYFSLSNLDISAQQISLISKLRSTLKVVERTQCSSITKELSLVLDDLVKLEDTVSSAVVTVNGELNKLTEIAPAQVKRLPVLSVEDYIEDESFTGVENELEDTGITDDVAIHVTPESKMALERNEKNHGGLRIRHITPVLSLIFERLSYDEIELQPDFQREDRVWKAARQSKLIESILMGLPLPAFYFAERSDGDWIVVDGLQRITTIFSFMKDEFSLNGLESVDEHYNGKFFSGLSRLDKRKIREYQITAHVIDDESDTENLIVELFHRINTYGVKLSDQEIRSAMYQGSSVTFLRYLSSSSEFLEATYSRVSPHRQKDMGLCLSALSYIALGYKNFNYKTYDSFLCTAMEKMNQLDLFLDHIKAIDDGESSISNESSNQYIELDNKFKQGLSLAHEIFEEFAFKKTLDSSRVSPISKPLFEVIVTTFAYLDESQVNELRASSEQLVFDLYQAIDTDSTEFSVWESDLYTEYSRGFSYSISSSTGKRVTVQYRFDAFLNILRNATGITLNITPVLGNKNDK